MSQRYGATVAHLSVVALAPCCVPYLATTRSMYRKYVVACSYSVVFAEDNGGLEGQDGGGLNFLALVALAQQEFEEDEENDFEQHEEEESEEGAQDMEDGETVPHGNQRPGEALPLFEEQALEYTTSMHFT